MPGDGTRELLQRAIQAIQGGEFPYEDKPAEPIDWTAYDQAQINEVNDVLCEIRDTVDRVWARLDPDTDEPTGPGRPPTPPPAVAKALLVQQYFEASNRQAEGLVKLFQEKLGIEDAFSYKTIERGYDNDSVLAIVETAFDDAAESVAHAEIGIAIDGTGLPTSLKVNYETAKRKGRKRDWEHMVAGFGQATGMMLTQTILASPQDAEIQAFGDVVPSAGRFPNLELGTADAGFLSRANVELLHEQGLTPRIFPKTNVGFQSKGHAGWHQMLRAFLEDAQAWLRDYHQRSKAESGFSVFQRVFNRPLRRRIKDRRDGEAKVRGCAFNLRRKVYLSYLTDWLNPVALGS